MEQGEHEAVVARLAAIPARIARAVAGWDAARLAAAPGAGVWSAQAILAHLRAADDILAPRAYMVLTRENPPLAAYDERRWAEVAGYGQADVRASLAVYTARRAELVLALRRLAPGDWARAGIHEARGLVTLLELMRGLAEHEEEHAAQIEAL
ncbi:MAG TPA: DinB family protein [Ktedonobacterales bacterium]